MQRRGALTFLLLPALALVTGCSGDKSDTDTTLDDTGTAETTDDGTTDDGTTEETGTSGSPGTTGETGATGETGSTGETGETDPPLTCEEVSVDECEATAGCALINGYLIADDGEGGECYDRSSPVPVGCMSEHAGCGDFPMAASSADDPSTCYYFGNTCIPDGWELCATDTGSLSNSKECE